MAELKFKVGDRVRIVWCTQHETSDCSHIHGIERDQTVTVINAWNKKYPYELSGSGVGWGDSELQLIAKGEEVKPYQRKTYKQRKDSVTVKKGALWQEACDDGDQEYVLLDKAFSKDTAGNGVHKIYTRSLVEDDPKNFVEVFKVEPEYQTREELDLFEEFKRSRAKVRVAKPAAKRVVRKVKKAA